jgi:hypothetical protein
VLGCAVAGGHGPDACPLLEAVHRPARTLCETAILGRTAARSGLPVDTPQSRGPARRAARLQGSGVSLSAIRALGARQASSRR